MNSFKKFSQFTCTFFLALILFSCKNDDLAPVPTITALSQDSGSVGLTIFISGNNFSAIADANIVKFNGTQATVTAATTTSLSVTVPAGATTGKVTVQVNKAIATSPNDFTITASQDDFRVKEIQSGDVWVSVYNYDANGVLTSVENYNADKSQLVYSETFSYNEADALITSVTVYPTSSLAAKFDYTYNSGQLVKRVLSHAPVSGGVIGAYTVFNIKEYTIVNNQISAFTLKDGSDKVLDSATYTYTTVNGDPQILIHHITPSVADATTVYYANVTDTDSTPDPENSNHLLIKNFTLSSNHKLDYTNTYTTNDVGLLHDFTSTYPNSPSYSGTLTYVYEAK
ncbi:MAG TPA: IPT/TIG domain-containing protein [Cyclobacteriaceae bacterium]